MIKTKVYVNIPAGAVAGGVESLFQLVDAINVSGGNGYIIWDKNLPSPIPEKYKHYNVKIDTEIEDNENNWVIYPEVWTEKIHTYKKMKKAIWWLSVDNNHNRFQDFESKEITHFYQSFYALKYLLDKKTSKYLPLFDYINENYTETEIEVESKKNIVCYNPIKGMDFTREIIGQNTDVNFVPITNLEESQVIELLKSSKVYIDFGHHPGRDRIPREAVLLGNCIITNQKGSAFFYNDILIDEKYKTNSSDIVGGLIKNCFTNFDYEIKNFELYNNVVKNQKEQLINLVKQYFV